LNAILSLSRLLLDRTDGQLSSEQERQVRFIRSSADNLTQMVNDLLDLARVEAGKLVVHPGRFTASDLFGALRGLLRPLVGPDAAVSLVMEEPVEIPELSTDESKVGQILRNFITNALKFTERGEVRVSAAMGENDMVLFSVADTGIGIAPEDQERVFEEFAQVDAPVQRRVRGTGLGLPLSRKLAELLGGSISLTSDLGAGSTFVAAIPRVYTGPQE
jgi:signal transduction histidine kinase